MCILRHSKSGSNLLLERGKNGRDIRDPGLTVMGRKAAESYGPTLRAILEENGFDPETTVVGASPLLRAQETAHLLFPETPIRRFEQLGEHGHIPENTPHCASSPSIRKGWPHFLKWLVKHSPSESIVAVGHRSFIRREILQPLGKDIDLKNMDGVILEYDGTSVRFVRYVLYGKPIATKYDRYIPRRTQTGGYTCKNRKQRGGFPPAIMGHFVENGLSLLPAAGYMLYRSSKKTLRRKRR